MIKHKECVCQKNKLIDLTGKKFNNLTVLSLHHRNAKSRTYYWLCKCDCGNEHIVSGKSLKNGSVKSCGCLKNESRRKSKEVERKRILSYIESKLESESIEEFFISMIKLVHDTDKCLTD